MRLSANSPRKVQLRSEIKDLKKAESSCKKQLQSDTTMEDVVRFLEKNYTQKASEHLKSQLTLLNKSPKGCRYTDEYKQVGYQGGSLMVWAGISLEAHTELYIIPRGSLTAVRSDPTSRELLTILKRCRH
nr:unnamed protein product [Callosobruchus chinensis]